MDFHPETRNAEPETRSLGPETRYPKPETRNREKKGGLGSQAKFVIQFEVVLSSHGRWGPHWWLMDVIKMVTSTLNPER